MSQDAGTYRALCSGGRVPVDCGILSPFIAWAAADPSGSGHAFLWGTACRPLGDRPTRNASIRSRKTKKQLAAEAVNRFEKLIDIWEKTKSKRTRERLQRVLTSACARMVRRVDAMKQEQETINNNVLYAMRELGLDTEGVQDEINKLYTEKPNGTHKI